MLEVRGLTAGYGLIQVLRGIDLTIGDGEIVAMIGPNGAGKTTTLNAIAGLHPHGGEVLLGGEPLPAAAEEVVRAGVALVPQGRRVFPSMTVEENLLMGAYAKGATWKGSAKRFAPIYEIFPRLSERRSQAAGSLSGGEQQMLVIGRALLSEPRVVLIDELSLGLAPLMVRTLLDTIVHFNREFGTVVPARRAGGHGRTPDRHLRLSAAQGRGGLPGFGGAPPGRRGRPPWRLLRLDGEPGSRAEVNVRRVFVLGVIATLGSVLFIAPGATGQALGPPPEADGGGGDAGGSDVGGFHGFSNFQTHAQAHVGSLVGYLSQFREENRLAGALSEINGPPANSRNIAGLYQRGEGAKFIYGVIGGGGGERGTLPDPPPGEVGARTTRRTRRKTPGRARSPPPTGSRRWTGRRTPRPPRFPRARPTPPTRASTCRSTSSPRTPRPGRTRGPWRAV